MARGKTFRRQPLPPEKYLALIVSIIGMQVILLLTVLVPDLDRPTCAGACSTVFWVQIVGILIVLACLLAAVSSLIKVRTSQKK